LSSQIDPAETSPADIERSGAVMFLEAWSNENPSPCAEPYNSQEILSTYSRAMACSFEDAMEIAAQALLAQWRSDNFKVSIEDSEAIQSCSYDDVELRALIRDKVQFNVGKLPRFIAEIYETQAQAEGMNKREYFYHLLREKGGDIPAYTQMDGRKF